MNSINRCVRSIALLAMLTGGLSGCGLDDVSPQDCPTEPCLDGQGPGTNEQPLPCGDDSGCDEDPPPDDGGTATSPCYPRNFLGKSFVSSEAAMNQCYGHWQNRSASNVIYCPSAPSSWSCPLDPLVFAIDSGGTMFSWSGTY